MIRKKLHLATACLPLLVAASVASAASNITNSLTGFTGNSTQAATQNALAAAGLNFTRTSGFDEVPPGSGNFVDPTVTFAASGATFGTLLTDAAGRNYIRTAATDYGNHSFTAEVTWVNVDAFTQAAYFGLGAGEYGSFNIADYQNKYSTAQLFVELTGTPAEVFTLKNRDYRDQFDDGTAATGMDAGPGTHRFRMTYDWFAKTADFAIDANYAGGPFTADITLPTVNTLDLYTTKGWPIEPARVYFGGDDGSVFKDLNITLSGGPTIYGDFNGNGTVTSADWIILRNNQHANLSAMTLQQAYQAGDLTADKANNHADFTTFKTLYEHYNGVGSFAVMVASLGVPEPSSFVAALAAAWGAVATARCARRQA
jgi:hypothetical protein